MSLLMSFLVLILASLIWLSINAGPMENELAHSENELAHLENELVPLPSSPHRWIESEITGYHFHAYFFQDNNKSTEIAREFR